MSATPSRQQQQPIRLMNRQQQQSSGSGEFQPRHTQQGDLARVSQSGERSHERNREQHPNLGQ
ncbi:MAG: hypothetical protein JWQ72_754 [Polaromonas sp.]|nr:hypothetical protein [Polaromonas sp.]